MLISRDRTKLIILALVSIFVFGLAEQGLAELILTEILYDVSSGDDGYEWVELYNFGNSPIDLSNYSLGYGGSDYTYGKLQLSGVIQPFSCFVVGGPKSEERNANPEYDQIGNFSPDIQNATENIADGVALFDVPANQITTDTVPIDAVIYGEINENNLIDETGKPGAVDVDDVPDDFSIEKTVSGWQAQSNPNPGDFSPPPSPNTIPWIQGDGDVSPRVGEIVNGISGVVTADIVSKEGFFMQDSLGDFNRTTSDGIFVYKGDNDSIPDVNLGEKVSVTGEIEEHNGLTEINVSDASSTVEIISSGNALPEPVELDPPALLEDALFFFESMEGMLVSAPDGVVVGPTKYGKFVIVRQSAFDGRYFYNPYDKNGERIMVDDAAGIRVDIKLDDIN